MSSSIKISSSIKNKNKKNGYHKKNRSVNKRFMKKKRNDNRGGKKIKRRKKSGGAEQDPYYEMNDEEFKKYLQKQTTFYNKQNLDTLIAHKRNWENAQNAIDSMNRTPAQLQPEHQRQHDIYRKRLKQIIPILDERIAQEEELARSDAEYKRFDAENKTNLGRAWIEAVKPVGPGASATALAALAPPVAPPVAPPAGQAGQAEAAAALAEQAEAAAALAEQAAPPPASSSTSKQQQRSSAGDFEI